MHTDVLECRRYGFTRTTKRWKRFVRVLTATCIMSRYNASKLPIHAPFPYQRFGGAFTWNSGSTDLESEASAFSFCCARRAARTGSLVTLGLGGA